MKASSDTLITVGKLSKARGLQGEIKVELLTDFPERFKHLGSVELELRNGEVRTLELERVSVNGTRMVVKFMGIDDRETADWLRGAYINVTREQLVPLDQDSFYDFDLIGMQIVRTDGKEVGTVIKIERYPANDVLIVSTATDDIMLPAIKDIVRNVDVEKKLITVDLPEGLPTYHKGSG